MKHPAKMLLGSLLLAATAGLAQANEQPSFSDPAFTSDDNNLIACSESSNVFYRSFRIREIKALN
ncbi:hypothetical protein [Erwinia sp. 198]|uniref:hypothetical protein n=1 Tax=Erwinia sp. 198 TaxID=2022746 RepID=UPI000F688CAD|nr:hypothetical protein [Erwinia sp. 198]RRZ91513.1 hypothetical protein EGK14_11315 [Erwinia sp. 198]